MHKESMATLEFNKIKEKLADFAVSARGKKMLGELEPSIYKPVIENRQAETTEARAILDQYSSIPLHSLTGIEALLEKPGKGMTLAPEELELLRGFLEECKRLKYFLKEKQHIAPMVCSYSLSIDELAALADEIRRCIRAGLVDDKASPQLAKIRKKITILEDRIKSKVEDIIKSPAYRPFLQESLVSIRQGRYVIPVKSECRRNIGGQVLDTSSSGSTVYIEPLEVSRLQDELNLLGLQEEKEVFRVLSALTELVNSCLQQLSVNLETMAQLDYAFAKGKLSKALGGKRVKVNHDRAINIVGGRHPLLGASAVPLSVSLGGENRALVITGPNTGGKTVALKTVGLLTLMVQAGLHPPVEEGSEFGIFEDVLADIGDGQSIEQSLSTFSSHIRNIINILRQAGKGTLVLLDELGAGTDPQEGTGLAITVLESLHQAGATLLVTSHYSEIKTFAAKTPGFTLGCMEFDLETLQPLYRLRLGQAGESNALLIALRLGMDRKLIERAHEITYKERKEYQTVQSVSAPGEEAPEQEKPEQPRHLELGGKIEKARRLKEHKAMCTFKVGDCVFISGMGRTGIVYEEINSKGEVGVMVLKRKLKVNHKRLSLHVEAEKLYPENYDLDIVLETKENRKKRKIMSKRHVKGLTITSTDNR
ncbi:recombination inhibitory protein MutS2 [Desulfocucumis palustris]|uniref:Recombination inhibitory protein MutS2 n=1 Tax=Desulfocucumis palustris TaxID=1898651 RepID=A0A2L2XEW7_9FIRM|nr:DNA mismatch repair protein [Desulfocucumis palustris]GBF34775.1 recombination inhibitory protein MutS2 [Desulfocucumis palustris]